VYQKILFIVTLLVSSVVSAQTEDAMTGFFQQSFGDLSEELQTASSEGKKGVFVMFDDKDCPWCTKMKATILNQKNVQDYYRKNFRIIRVDSLGDGVITDFKGNETTEKQYAKESRVRATPVILFVDLEGNVIQRHTGAVRNVEEFLWLGEFVVDGHYDETTFPAYKRTKKRM
jgi:thioredoxin-related protein